MNTLHKEMSKSTSLSLSKHQISNVKQTISDLKNENTEYINTMKRLIDSTQDVNRDNKKLEQGIQLQRNYLLRLTEKVDKGPKLIEKSKKLNLQALHRMKKYKRQISKQTRGISTLRIRDEIEKLLCDISKLKKKTTKYKQKIDNEQSVIEKINKLNELKHGLSKMNQCLTEEAQKLIVAISKIKVPTEIEKHVDELKQKVLKSDEIRKKLEAEDPDFQNSNSVIFAHIDEIIKQTVPIFDDLESLFINSSGDVQLLKQSSDPISSACSDLSLSEKSKISQKSSAMTDNDMSSLKMTKSFFDSSSSLVFSEQNSKNMDSVFSKTLGSVLNKNDTRAAKDNDGNKEAESDNPSKLNNKNFSVKIITKSNSGSDSDNSKLKTNKSSSKIQQTKEENESDEYESEQDDNNDKNGKNLNSKSQTLNKENSDLNKSNLKSKLKAKSQTLKTNNEDSDINPTNAKAKSNLKAKSPKLKSMNNDDDSDFNVKSKSKRQKYKTGNETDESKSKKFESDSKYQNLSDSELQKMKSKTKSKSLKSKSEYDYETSDSNENKILELREKESYSDDQSESNSAKNKNKQDSNSEDEESAKNKTNSMKRKSKSGISKQESEKQENSNKQSKSRTKIRRPKSNLKETSGNFGSKSDNEESELKNSKKLALSNKSLLSKSADESSYPSSSSQENLLNDQKNDRSDNSSLSEHKQSTKKIKKRRSSKNPNLQTVKSDANFVNNTKDDDIGRLNLESNQLSKTQPRTRIEMSKKSSNNAESESNPILSASLKRRRKKRKSNNMLSEYSSSALLPPSSNDKEAENAKEMTNSNTKSDIETSSNKSKSMKNKTVKKDQNSMNNDSDSDNDNDGFNANKSKGLNLFNPIANRLISTGKNNEENKYVLKKRKSNKPSESKKKEIDSDSDTYEPCIQSNRNNKSGKTKSSAKRRWKPKQTNNDHPFENILKDRFNRINSNNDNENVFATTETYNDASGTDDENENFSEKKKKNYSNGKDNQTSTFDANRKNDKTSAFDSNRKNGRASNFDSNGKDDRIFIFDSNGNKILGSIFVDEDGIPLKNTQAFDKEGNSIKKQLSFDSDGIIGKSKEVFDEFGNKVKSVIQLNRKFEPISKKIFDSKGNEIKDASKIKLENGNKKVQANPNDEIIEEEECSENSMITSTKPKSDEIGNPANLKIYDKEQNRIKNPVLLDSKSGRPFNTKLFDSNDQLINDPIETNSNGKPKIKVFDSNGNQVNCLISVDEDGAPIKPEIYDENGNQIETLKPFISKNKKKIKKRKNHRLFDKENKEIKNILLINSLGKPLNVSVFDSEGEEVKESITFNQNLFTSNKEKVDAIVEVDSHGHSTNSALFDSKGNEISDLNFLIQKDRPELYSSASLSSDEERRRIKKKKVKTITVSIDENKRPINTTLFDSEGNELSVVEFDSNGSPKKQIYNKNKKRVTKIIIEDREKGEGDDDDDDDIESISSLSSSSDSVSNDQLGRSKSDLNQIFCDANGNEFKNPIFVDIYDKPYNNVKVYDSQCHLYNSPLKYDEKTGTPEIQIYDFHGLPFSHVVQIGTDGNPTKFTLYNIHMEPVTFPTLKIHKPKREKLEIIDDKKNLNIISFENPDKEEEEEIEHEKRPKKSSQTKWTRSILSNFISSHLDKSKLNIAVVDANVSLIHLEEEIHNLEEEKLFLERKVNSQIEARDRRIGKKTNVQLVVDVCEIFIEPTPVPDRSEFVRDICTQNEMDKAYLEQLANEIESNSKYLADNIVFEQQKITADSHFPELEKIYFKLMNKNSKLKHVIDKLESHLNIVTSDSMADYASKETRMRIRYEDSKKEKISVISQTESSISEGSIQINDLNNKIEDQRMLIEMLKKQIAEQQRKERPDAKKLCLELDGLRDIDKRNRENLKMLEMEQNSIEIQASKISELIDDKSLANMQLSVDDYQKQLNDIKESFARMRKKGVKKANPLTNKYELMGLEERIKEAKKQIADVKRKESVAVNKIDKRIKILQSYGLRIPMHKRVSNGECI